MWPRQVGGGGGGRQPHVRRAAGCALSGARRRRPAAPAASDPAGSACCDAAGSCWLLVSGLLQPPAASLSWLAQQLSVICHVQSHVSRVISLHAWLARLLTPDFLEQTDELAGSGIWGSVWEF